jgi:hypothetical protein
MFLYGERGNIQLLSYPGYTGLPLITKYKNFLHLVGHYIYGFGQYLLQLPEL